jgi:hypothetical protein
MGSFPGPIYSASWWPYRLGSITTSPRHRATLDYRCVKTKTARVHRNVTSKLHVHARADDRDRAAIAVVGRIDDELIIERHRGGEQRERIIRLDDLFGAGMGQHAVADENAQAPVIEKLFVHARNTIDDICGRRQCRRTCWWPAPDRSHPGSCPCGRGSGSR